MSVRSREHFNIDQNLRQNEGSQEVDYIEQLNIHKFNEVLEKVNNSQRSKILSFVINQKGELIGVEAKKKGFFFRFSHEKPDSVAEKLNILTARILQQETDSSSRIKLHKNLNALGLRLNRNGNAPYALEPAKQVAAMALKKAVDFAKEAIRTNFPDFPDGRLPPWHGAHQWTVRHEEKKPEQEPEEKPQYPVKTPSFWSRICPRIFRRQSDAVDPMD